jgi:CHAP domain
MNRRSPRRAAGIGILSLLILLSGCTTLPRNDPEAGDAFRAAAENDSLSGVQRRLLYGAQEVLETQRLSVNGEKYRADCTGTIQAIYAFAGIDLRTPMESYSGNGVTRLNSYLKEKGLLYSTRTPSPGDLVFWDNTYDRNGDGLWNDPLTHVGMVVAVSDEGTISYVHHNYRRGIVLAHMNLQKPDTVTAGDRELNSAMRMRDGKVYPRWLSSHLYRELGKGWELDRAG